MKLRVCFVMLSFLSALVCTTHAQTAASNPTPSSTRVPRLIKFSGVARDESGKPITGVVGITFSLYKDQQGGSPLWMETQNAQPDTNGHYTALLGSASADGVPLEVFSAGEAQWLGVQIQGQPAQTRVLLVSVPYALKAHEAETLSGRGISDFVLVNKTASASPSANNVPTASDRAGGSSLPPPNGPTNFVGTNATQIVGVTQKGMGTGLSATATTHAAVAGTITGKSNTAVYGQASNTSKGSNAAGVTGVANSETGPGVQGVSTSPKGFGVQGVVNASSGGTAVSGLNNATSGVSNGVSGQSASTGNGSAGVVGNESATTGQVYGVTGYAGSTTNGAAAVNGFQGAATGVVFGVSGSTNSTTNGAAGVTGFEGGATGTVYGVSGGANSTSTNSAAVWGFEGASSGQVYGVSGNTSSTGPNAAAVNGFASASTGVVWGVSGSTNSTTNGAAGISGGEGATTGQVYGVTGYAASATNGAAAVNGFEGATSGQVFGVSGSTNSVTDGSAGVTGFEGGTTGNTRGVQGNVSSTNGYAVYGDAAAASGFTVGVFGDNHSSGGVGVLGKAQAAGGIAGSFANTAGSGLILLGQSGSAFNTVFSVDASGNGFYAGNLNVTGKLTKGSGSFKIDHPLDPANKYLSHSFVESPDMMNVYNGVVVLDAHGSAWVVLPDYFEALNRDFRYQLTAIGAPGPNLYIAKKVSGNRFLIAGGKPHREVSWQVTGIRHDAYANAYRIPTEENKPAAERGYYLHPDVFGEPASKNTQAAGQKASATDQLAKMSNP